MQRACLDPRGDRRCAKPGQTGSRQPLTSWWVRADSSGSVYPRDREGVSHRKNHYIQCGTLGRLPSRHNRRPYAQSGMRLAPKMGKKRSKMALIRGEMTFGREYHGENASWGESNCRSVGGQECSAAARRPLWRSGRGVTPRHHVSPAVQRALRPAGNQDLHTPRRAERKAAASMRRGPMPMFAARQDNVEVFLLLYISMRGNRRGAVRRCPPTDLAV